MRLLPRVVRRENIDVPDGGMAEQTGRLRRATMGKIGTPRAHDMIGFKTGRLTVLSRHGTRGTHAMWECVCVCGGKTIASTSDLRRAHRKSCGCLKTEFRPKLEPVKGVDPVVKFLFRAMNTEHASQRETAKRAGVSEKMFFRWRTGHTQPTVPDMRAALGALGYELTIVRGE